MGWRHHDNKPWARFLSLGVLRALPSPVAGDGDREQGDPPLPIGPSRQRRADSTAPPARPVGGAACPRAVLGRGRRTFWDGAHDTERPTGGTVKQRCCGQSHGTLIRDAESVPFEHAEHHLGDESSTSAMRRRTFIHPADLTEEIA